MNVVASRWNPVAFLAALACVQVLMAADTVAGFFEFEPSPEGKQPYLPTSPDGFSLALAGLWSRWSRAAVESVVTFTIITTSANEDVAPLHDRMPALLRREDWGSWLDARGRSVDRLGREYWETA